MFQSTSGSFQSHVEQVRRRLREKPLAFEAALSMELVQEALQRCQITFRERVYSPWVTLWAFLDQILCADGSCRDAVHRVIAWLTARNRPACSPDPGHYCEARRRLPLRFFRELLALQAERARAEVPQQWKWLGKHDVKIVDGTTFSMPDTPANRAAFPPHGEKQPGTRFPLLRAVVVFCLPLGLLEDFAFGPCQGKGTGEISLLRRLWHTFAAGDVMLADRYYCSSADVWQLLRRQVGVVVRHFSRRTCLTPLKRLGKNDTLCCWHRPKFARQKMSREEYRQLPASLPVRIVRVRVTPRGFRVREFEILTTLLEADVYTPGRLAELYFLRWRAELSLNDIKTSLGLDVLRCRTPEMIHKELLAGFLAHNTIRLHMAQAAECLQIPLGEISFKGTLSVLRTFTGHSPTPKARANRVALIASHRVGKRPGRSEPRVKKRKGKPYPTLKTSRPTFTKSPVA